MPDPVPCRYHAEKDGCTHPHPAIVKSLSGATYCVVAYYYQSAPADPRIMPPGCALMEYQVKNKP